MNSRLNCLSRANENNSIKQAFFEKNRNVVLITNTDSDNHLLDDNFSIGIQVKDREKALIKYFKDSAKITFPFDHDEPLLIVGRRWNSWYPSFFNAPGGAYAIVGPCDLDNNRPTAVIDPGFDFLKTFMTMGISIADINSCIVSHNHPDHIGGIFEFIATRHVLDKNTHLFCNPTTRTMFSDCSNIGLTIKELTSNELDILNYPISNNNWLRVKVKPFETAHQEIGITDASKGLTFNIEDGCDENSLRNLKRVVILGDTQYNPTQNHNIFIPELTNHNNKAVIVHIGSSQMKNKTGKHLYFIGLKKLLRDMEATLDRNDFQGKLPVLVSEWGLEHATLNQINKICGKKLKYFNRTSPIIDTIKLLQNGLEKIILIPADIGLYFGIYSGCLYIADGSKAGASKVEASKIKFDVTEDGIKYFV